MDLVSVLYVTKISTKTLWALGAADLTRTAVQSRVTITSFPAQPVRIKRKKRPFEALKLPLASLQFDGGKKSEMEGRGQVGAK